MNLYKALRATENLKWKPAIKFVMGGNELPGLLILRNALRDGNGGLMTLTEKEVDDEKEGERDERNPLLDKFSDKQDAARKLLVFSSFPISPAQITPERLILFPNDDEEHAYVLVPPKDTQLSITKFWMDVHTYSLLNQLMWHIEYNSTKTDFGIVVRIEQPNDVEVSVEGVEKVVAMSEQENQLQQTFFKSILVEFNESAARSLEHISLELRSHAHRAAALRDTLIAHRFQDIL